VVSHGYLGLLSLMESCGEVLLLATFQLLAPIVWGHPLHWGPAFGVLLFPLVSILVMVLRNSGTVELIWKQNAEELDIVDGVREACSNFSLISDFRQQRSCVEKFEREVQEFNKADVRVKQRLLNNVLVCPWISALLVSSYVVIGGWRVVENEQTLGMFLATISVITQMGVAFSHIFKVLVDMQTCFPALLRVTNILNMATPLQEMANLSHEQCQECSMLERKLETASRASHKDSDAMNDIPIVDLIPLRVKDPYFVLDADGVSNHGLQLRGCIQVQQGTLVSLIGPHAHGKSTILRVLAGCVLPSQLGAGAGLSVVVPQHLRVLHVSSEPLFFDASLSDNLRFGLLPGDPAGSDQRIEAILRRLGLDSLAGEAAASEAAGVKEMPCGQPMRKMSGRNHLAWFRNLSETQRALFSLARALITNPEVLCIEKPTLPYCDSIARDVLSILHEHVRKRGLEQGHTSSQELRPRTVIMTNVNSLVQDYADAIFLVKEGEIRQLDKEHISQHMLEKDFEGTPKWKARTNF